MNIQYLGAYTSLTTLVVGIPVLMIFYMIPVFASFNIIVAKAAKLLPNYNMNIILQKVFIGEGISIESTYSLVVISVWIIMTAAAYTYNKIGLDK